MANERDKRLITESGIAARVAAIVEPVIEDLGFLGLDFDQGPIFQSARAARYAELLERLERLGRVYPCTCSRREIALASSAPHGPSDEGSRYPGTCRVAGRARIDRPASLRFRTEPGDLVAHADRRFKPVSDMLPPVESPK